MLKKKILKVTLVVHGSVILTSFSSQSRCSRYISYFGDEGTDILKVICFAGTKIQSNKFAQRNVKKNQRAFLFCFNKNNNNQVESLFFGSLAFNNQNCAQTKDNYAGTCVPASPAFRNSVKEQVTN